MSCVEEVHKLVAQTGIRQEELLNLTTSNLRTQIWAFSVHFTNHPNFFYVLLSRF